MIPSNSYWFCILWFLSCLLVDEFCCDFCEIYNTLKNFRETSPVVQNHIKQVYLALSCAVVAAAVGAYLYIFGTLVVF